jgi:hypothetical protein
MVRSIGKPTEIVVAANQSVIDDLKPMILNLFEADQPYFALEEVAYFNAIPINFKALKSSMIKNKTILVLVTDENKEKFKDDYGLDIDQVKTEMRDGHFTVLKDVWAKPQHVAIVYGRSEGELKEYLLKNGTNVREAMLDVESKDLNRKYSKSKTAKKHYEALKKELGCGVMVPASFSLDHQRDGFFWFRDNNDKYTSSITVHAYPYEDTSQFSDENIIMMRDSFAKMNIPGELEGTYMATSSSELALRFTETRYINGNYVKIMRSRWTVKGAFMGGPFTLFVFHHKPTNQLVAVEGFLYSPDNPKGPLYRVYDALLWSFE